MICDVFVLDILASWVQNHNVLLRIASTLCPPLERWRSSAVISSSTTTGPTSWRWLMLSPKNISRLPSRVSSFRSVVSDEIGVFTGYRWTTHTYIHMLSTIFPDICQFSRCFDFIQFLSRHWICLMHPGGLSRLGHGPPHQVVGSQRGQIQSISPSFPHLMAWVQTKTPGIVWNNGDMRGTRLK